MQMKHKILTFSQLVLVIIYVDCPVLFLVVI